MLTLLFISSGCHAASEDGWRLNNDLSKLSFVSIKATDIGEVHSFTRLAGTIASDGVVDLNIDLSSVETLIPIRNERMQEFLFETGAFPVAHIAATLDTAILAGLKPGDVQIQAVEAALTLKEKTIPLTMQLIAAKVSDKRLVVSSLQPILLNAAAVGLSEGVEKLRDIAGLPNISQAVPVGVVLTFER
jgi:hypothetical protein